MRTVQPETERSFQLDRSTPRAAAEWFRNHAESAGLSPERFAQAELCLDELVTNVFRHGDKGTRPVTLTVSLKRGPGEFLVVVEDDGRFFDPRQAPDPLFASSLEEASPGGRGVFLVRSIADELRYEHTEEGRNRSTLVFRHGD